ncbi:hypothetical protein [[Limnothrix rosea] IAM M-220]|uniref:hypothetical protein n=1 Tax=[Limnothrix rosea] IAM M-220 TaxID=454133 RepID=UPI00095F5422|nr:hypothetical protein [[Limnothrix rosea] IAM M-220]OKH12153.1 hypothetical protein NIES208_16425 [[Limnothrix rosea] IAM M-220]
MPVKQSDFLAQNFVSLESEEINEGHLIVHGVAFHLTQESLPTLLSIKAAGKRLKFSRHFVLAWQRYALFQNNHGDLRRTWSFSLSYESQGILQTLVTRDGEVVNQVCADVLHHSILHQQLREIHYWLIAQLLGKLYLRRPRGKWINVVAWSMAIALVLLFVLFHIGTVLSQPLLLILPIVVSVGVLKWLLARGLFLSLASLQQLFVQRLLWGAWAKDPQKQLKGLQYLRRL